MYSFHWKQNSSINENQVTMIYHSIYDKGNEKKEEDIGKNRFGSWKTIMCTTHFGHSVGMGPMSTSTENFKSMNLGCYKIFEVLKVDFSPTAKLPFCEGLTNLFPGILELVKFSFQPRFTLRLITLHGKEIAQMSRSGLIFQCQ